MTAPRHIAKIVSVKERIANINMVMTNGSELLLDILALSHYFCFVQTKEATEKIDIGHVAIWDP